MKPLLTWPLLALLFVAANSLEAQLPLLDDPAEPRRVDDAASWSAAGGAHVLRQELDRLYPSLRFQSERRDAIFLLLGSTFETQEYEEAWQWSSQFLAEFPNDRERASTLFINGVSAFQTRRLPESFASLGEFLRTGRQHPRYAEAWFWKAMAELDRGDWKTAEDDVRKVYDDSTAGPYHDIALFGWALSLERRGDYPEAIRLLEQFDKKFPESTLISDVRLRLASLYLRTGRPQLTTRFLEEVDPNPLQREEVGLLRGESDLQLSRWSRAQEDYQQFLQDFPGSRRARPAMYGLAWSLLKQGNYPAAIMMFDSLGRGSDSLAYDALYQAGVLALLSGKSGDALARFDSISEHSPYDTYAEKAYIQTGMAQYRTRHFREARRAFQLAARLFPESPRRASSYRMLGESNIALGDFSNAQYAFSQVRRLNGEPADYSAAMFQEGVSLYHLGRFKSSAELFGEFLAKYPSDSRIGPALIWRGEALYQDYRFPEAERAFTEAVRRYPDSPKRPDALYGIAWSQFEQKEFSRAAESFEKFTREFAGDNRSLDASLRRADCYFFMGQYDRAQDLYASLASSRTDSRNVEYAAFQIAMSYIQRGESQRGIDELRNFLNRFPNSIFNEVVQFNIGWEFFSKERYSDALPELRLVLQRYPYSQLIPRVLFNMGDAWYNLKQYDSSRYYYQRVIKEYPQSLLVPDALNGLQFTFNAQGKPEGALAEIDTLLAQKAVVSPQEDLVLRKGDILFAQNDFAGAIGEYRSVLSMHPGRATMAKTLRQLGRSYEMENNPRQAIAYYRQVVSDYSETDVAPQSALSLEIACLKLQQYRDAVAAAEKFEQSYSDSPLLVEVLYNHGLALTGASDQSGALSRFRQVITQFPADVFADRSRLRMAGILISQGNNRAAIDTLTSVLSRRSDDLAAEALYTIGDCSLKAKRSMEALQAFTDLIRQYSDFPYWLDRAYIGQGDAYLKLQQKKQARASYELALKSADPDVRKDAQARLKKVKR